MWNFFLRWINLSFPTWVWGRIYYSECISKQWCHAVQHHKYYSWLDLSLRTMLCQERQQYYCCVKVTLPLRFTLMFQRTDDVFALSPYYKFNSLNFRQYRISYWIIKTLHYILKDTIEHSKWNLRFKMQYSQKRKKSLIIIQTVSSTNALALHKSQTNIFEWNLNPFYSPEENTCFRCFNLQMVSKNIILLIHNEGDINSKCSSTAEIAALKCPGAIALLNDEEKFQNDFSSIILYSEFNRTLFALVIFITLFCPTMTGTSERDSPRRSEFCPFNFFDGEIKFDYYLNENRLCSGYESTLSQCPSGSMLNLRFRGCSSGSPSTVKFECIGHWSALGEHYLAVIDWINGTVPRYKCGVSSTTFQNHSHDMICFSRHTIMITMERPK